MMLSRIGAGHRREPSLQSPAMSLPPRETASWPLAARLGGIVVTALIGMTGNWRGAVGCGVAVTGPKRSEA